MEAHIVSLLDSLTPIPRGWHVKDVGNGRCVDVVEMAFNYRLLLSDHGHLTYRHGWCYFGHGEDDQGRPRSMEQALLTAVAAALIWDGEGCPQAYDKQVC